MSRDETLTNALLALGKKILWIQSCAHVQQERRQRLKLKQTDLCECQDDHEKIQIESTVVIPVFREPQIKVGKNFYTVWEVPDKYYRHLEIVALPNVFVKNDFVIGKEMSEIEAHLPPKFQILWLRKPIEGRELLQAVLALLNLAKTKYSHVTFSTLEAEFFSPAQEFRKRVIPIIGHGSYELLTTMISTSELIPSRVSESR